MSPLVEKVTLIRQRITAVADSQTQADLTRLLSGAKSVGVKVPQLRQLALEFRREYAQMTLSEAADLLDALCPDRCREEILFGVFLLGRYGKKALSLEWPRLNYWTQFLDNWETCDQLASIVGAPLVVAHLSYVDYLVEMAHSSNLWQRRFAAATAAQMNHKGQLFTAETWRVCTILLPDLEPMVWKAVGWAIREISQKDEMAAYHFVMENRARIPARLLRAATEKLSPAYRQELQQQMGATG